MGTENGHEDRNGAEYLAQLLKDKKQIQAFPNVFIHLERLLDDEINKVRITLFNLEKKPLLLPEEEGPKVQLTEKLFVPVKEHPDFNFVGRILGPRGITAKQLERDTGCKIMVRGKGSMRDKKKEEQMRGKPNWEHLSEELHVLIVVEDTQHRAEAKMSRALEEVKKLLVPAPEGEDDLKKIQLMELAIMNGTYRDNVKLVQAQAAAAQMQQRLIGQPVLSTNPAMMQAANLMGLQNQLYRPQQNTQQVLLSPRLATSAPSTQQSMLGGMPPPLVSPADPNTALMYSSGALPSSPDLSQYGLAAQSQLLEYQAAIDQSAAGAVPKVRRTAVAAASAAHPYQRI